MSKENNLPSVPRFPVGEVRIWLTGLGVAAGLLMVLGLLGIIVCNGLDAFWPKDAYSFSLKPEEGEETGKTFFGSIAKESDRREYTSTGEIRNVSQYQIFTGSKEVYGQTFRYIDKEAVVKCERPSDLLEIERLEGGRIIARPLFLQDSEGSVIESGSTRFLPELEKWVESGSKIHQEISRVEKKKIGSINARLDDAGRDLKALHMSYSFQKEHGTETAFLKDKPVVREKDPVGARKDLEKEIEHLRERYSVYAKEIEHLRKAEEGRYLHYQIGDGVPRKLEAGRIVSFMTPNKTGWTDKAGIFLSRIRRFVTEDPREANTEGGIFPAIFGTFVMTVLMSIMVTPIGVIAAIYLREYARQGVLVRVVRICVNNLAGVPSIVFGVFGLGFFVYFVGGTIDELFFSKKLLVSQTPTFGTSGILWASLTLALMTLPVIIVTTEEAISAVPKGLREAALACGASKWQMIRRIILPCTMPGILTGVILAMARGAGEVAPLMMTGVVKLAPTLALDLDAPFIHLERKFMHLGFHIYDVGFQSPDSDAARSIVFATTLLLIVMVIAMNLTAIIIRNKLRKKHQLSSF